MSITIIGMGLSPADLTPSHQHIIESAEILVGGRRHLDAFCRLHAEKWPIGKDLDGLITTISKVMVEKSVVVLASGDPLFFGIGARLVDALGLDNVTIHPNVSSVAAAFARIKTPWQDAKVLSVHGRFDAAELLTELRRYDKIAVLTDPKQTPAWLAGFLSNHCIGGFEMWVMERLGADDEKIYHFHQAGHVKEHTFKEPNLVILKRAKADRPPSQTFYPGMPDNAFVHERGLITKSEIRAVTLAKLKLDRSDLVLWDLGAGSGSVGLEASWFLGQGMVWAVEKNVERIKQIKENRDRFRICNLEAIQAQLPNGLADLPDPDRVFVGGGGKDLPKILQTAAGRLRAGGVMVVNTVLIQSVSAALEMLEELGFETDMVQMQVSGGKKMPWGARLEAQNPVWIVQGKKIR